MVNHYIVVSHEEGLDDLTFYVTAKSVVAAERIVQRHFEEKYLGVE